MEAAVTESQHGQGAVTRSRKRTAAADIRVLLLPSIVQPNAESQSSNRIKKLIQEYA